MEETHYRISKVMGACLITTAFTIDLIEFLLEWMGIGILGLSTLISLSGSLLFWIWFKMLDVPFVVNPKRFFTLATTCFLEIIPGLDAVGGFFWTAGTILIVLMVRSEDKGGVTGALSGAAMRIAKRRYTSYKSAFNNPAKLAEWRQGFGRNMLSVSKAELFAEATGRTKEYQKRQLQNISTLNPQQNTLDLSQKSQTRSARETPKRETPQYIKDWEEATRKLNDQQTRKLADKAGVDISDVIGNQPKSILDNIPKPKAEEMPAWQKEWMDRSRAAQNRVEATTPTEFRMKRRELEHERAKRNNFDLDNIQNAT